LVYLPRVFDLHWLLAEMITAQKTIRMLFRL
jgi:hypothetical protein